MAQSGQSSVETVLECLHQVVDSEGRLFYDWAVIALLRLSPTVAALPAALAAEEIWPSGLRSTAMKDMATLWSRVREKQNYWQVDPAGLGGSKGGVSFSWLVDAARARAAREGAPSLREWHLTSVMVENGEVGLRTMGINLDVLLRRVGEIEGRVELSSDDLEKAWCFADANVFLQYEVFDQVDWPSALKLRSLVLAVPTSVLRALDHYKSDARSERRQKRARLVLPRLAKYSLEVSPGALAPVRPRVELLLRDREPFIPAGFDANDQDDRIIADALDFRWTHPGARVIVLSGDYTVRIKARSYGLEQMAVPGHLEVPSSRPRPSDTSSGEKGQT